MKFTFIPKFADRMVELRGLGHQGVTVAAFEDGFEESGYMDDCGSTRKVSQFLCLWDKRRKEILGLTRRYISIENRKG